jgi:hypothetical protein
VDLLAKPSVVPVDTSIGIADEPVQTVVEREAMALFRAGQAGPPT